MQCIKCGGDMIGDGYSEPLRCEFAEVEDGTEPDANPVYCDFSDEVAAAAPEFAGLWEAKP